MIRKFALELKSHLFRLQNLFHEKKARCCWKMEISELQNVLFFIKTYFAFKRFIVIGKHFSYFPVPNTQQTLTQIIARDSCASLQLPL